MTAPSTPSDKKRVFKYGYVYGGGFYKLEHVYKLLDETPHHVLVRRWYGKRWYPKNMSWRVE